MKKPNAIHGILCFVVGVICLAAIVFIHIESIRGEEYTTVTVNPLYPLVSFAVGLVYLFMLSRHSKNGLTDNAEDSHLSK